MKKTSSKILNSSNSNQVNYPQKKGLLQILLNVQLINQTIAYFIFITLSFVCFIELQNYILGVIMMIDVIIICYLKCVKYSSKRRKKFNENNKDIDPDLQKKKSSPSLSNQEKQYFKFTQLGLITALYIATIEIIIKINQDLQFYIIISMFISLFSNISNKNNKYYKIQVCFIIIQQLYTILRLQATLKFNLYSFIVNLLYFIYQISSSNITLYQIKQQEIIVNNTNKKTEQVMRIYQSILSVIPEGLAVLNSEKKLIYANPTLKKILQSNNREEIQQILMNLGNNQSNDNIDKTIKKTTTIIEQSQQNKGQIYDNKDKILKQGNEFYQNEQKNNSKFNNKYHSLSEIQSKEINLFAHDNSDIRNTNSRITHKQSFKQLQTPGPNLQPGQSQESDNNKQESNHQSGYSSPIKKLNQSNQNTINLQKNSSQSESHQINERIRTNKSIKKDSRYCNMNNKVDYHGRTMSVQQRGHNPQQNTEQSEILSYKGFGIEEINKTFSSKEIASQYFAQQQIQNGSCHHITNAEQNTFKIHSPLGVNKQFTMMPNDGNIIPQTHIKCISQLGDQDKKERQQQQSEKLQQNQYNEVNDAQQQNGSHYNNQSFISIQQLEQRIKEKTSQSNSQSKNKELGDIERQEIAISKLKESIQKQKHSKQQPIPVKSKTLNPQGSQINDYNRMKTQQYKYQNTQQNGQKVSNDTAQNNITFSLKVKPKNSSSLKVDNQIILEKTDVSNIIDMLFDDSSIREKIKKNLNSQQINEKTYSIENERNQTIFDSKNLVASKNENQNNQFKEKSFFSQLQKQGVLDLSYIQHTDTLTKIQVKYKNQDLVVQFLLVDVLTENSKKDPLIIIMVQDLWQDLYQKKVQEIQKEKMRVFASLSHELRTPLNCSISMLEVLKDEIETENPTYIQEYLNPALFSNKLLLNQINDILDFVQMDNGKFKYSFYDFNVLGLLKDCEKLVSMQAKMKKIELRIYHDQNIPDTICSDPNRIRQIILNFLSNSLKFTKRGYIELGIVSISNGLYQIFVKDTGIGIQKENLDQIFEFCAKINYENNDVELNRQGCGLGMIISNTIAKGLIKKQKSQGILVESVYGFGSKFSIIIEDMNYQQQDNIPILLTEQYSPNKNKGKSNIKNIMNSEESSINKYNSKNTSSPNNHKKSAINVSYIITEDDNSIIDTQNTTQIPFNRNIENKITFNKLRYTDNNQEVILSDNSGEKTQKTKNYQNSEFFDSANISDDQENVKKNNKIQQFQEIKQIPESTYFQKESSQDIRSNSPTTYSSKKQHHLQTKIQQLIHNFPIKYDELNLSLNQQDQINQFSSLTLNYAIDSQLFEQNSTLNKTNFKGSNCFNPQSDFENNYQDRYKISCIQEDKKEESECSSPKLKLNTGVALQSISKINQKQSPRNHVFDMEQEGFTSYAMQKPIDLTSKNSRSNSSQKIDIQKTVYSAKTKKQISSTKNEYDTLSTVVPKQTIDQIIEKNISRQLQCNCPQILIVDDNQFNLYALTKTVQQFQFILDTASDGIQAIEKIKQQFYSNCCKVPKIIFMDIDMPIKNGYETALDIHQFYQIEQVIELPVIIACTAFVGQEDHDKAIESGMDDFINKPILKKAFLDLLFNWRNIFI